MKSPLSKLTSVTASNNDDTKYAFAPMFAVDFYFTNQIYQLKRVIHRFSLRPNTLQLPDYSLAVPTLRPGISPSGY